jgi:branched-subunit amino acid ABC-type transport system permease component
VDGVTVEVLGVLGSAALAAIVAVGLAVSFRLMGVINLAHGGLIAVGAYTGVALGAHTPLPWAAVVVLSAGVGGVLGVAMELLVLRRVHGDPELSILATFGLALVLVQLITLTVGRDFQSMDNPLPGATSIGAEGFPTYRLLLIALAVLLVAGVLVALSSTGFGLRVRAAAEDATLARYAGVEAARVRTLVFAVSAALAAAAGVLVAPISTISPDMGDDYLFAAFIVVIVSGSRVSGVVPGALAVALVTTVVSRVWDENLARIAVLGVALMLLLWVDRPAVQGVV